MFSFKMALHQIKKKKLKCFIVFITICLTVIVTVISSSFSNSVNQTRQQQFRDNMVDSQIYIHTKSSENMFFDNNIIDKVKQGDNIKSAQGVCAYNVANTEDNSELYLYGVDIKKANDNFPYSISQGDINFENKDGVIISDYLAKKYNYKINSKINVETPSGKKDLTVKCIAQEKGFFKNNQIIVVCDISYAQSLIDIGTQLNSIDVSINNLDSIDKTTDNLNEILEYNQLEAKPRYDVSNYYAYVTPVTLALKIFSIFLIVISLYLLIALFKSTAYENIDEMVTLKSIGVTTFMYEKIYLIQFSILFISATLIGFILSFPCMYLLVRLFINGHIALKLDMSMLIEIAFIFIISMICVLHAIHNVSKKSIVSILNGGSLNYIKSMKYIYNIILVIIDIIGIIVLFYVNQTTKSIIALFSALVLSLLLCFLISGFFSKGIIKLASSVFRNSVKPFGIALKSLKNDILSYTESIEIISAVIVITICTIIISSSLSYTLKSVYNNANIIVSCENNDKSIATTQEKIDSLKVKDVEKQKRYVCDYNKTDVLVAGIDVDKHIKVSENEIAQNDKATIFTKLNKPYTALVSSSFLNSNNLKVNDNINIDNKTFKIVGQFNTFEQMGRMLYISDETYRESFSNYGNYVSLIECNDVNSVYNQLIKGKESSVYKAENINDIYKESNNQDQLIINTIYILCAMLVLVSIIGFINNLIQYIISQKQNYFIYKSIGVTNKDLISVGLFKSLFISICSALLGIIISILVTYIVIQILSYYVGNILININYISLTIFILVIQVIIILSYLLSLRKLISKKLNTI